MTIDATQLSVTDLKSICRHLNSGSSTSWVMRPPLELLSNSGCLYSYVVICQITFTSTFLQVIIQNFLCLSLECKSHLPSLLPMSFARVEICHFDPRRSAPDKSSQYQRQVWHRESGCRFNLSATPSHNTYNAGMKTQGQRTPFSWSIGHQKKSSTHCQLLCYLFSLIKRCLARYFQISRGNNK